jgi:hypothetical protein
MFLVQLKFVLEAGSSYYIYLQTWKYELEFKLCKLVHFESHHLINKIKYFEFFTRSATWDDSNAF